MHLANIALNDAHLQLARCHSSRVCPITQFLHPDMRILPFD
jgi:hypothetical protein